MSTEEQLQLLISRGMSIDMENEKAQEILLDIGYYRLGFYWHPFEKDVLHNFKTETKFSDIVALYYLDVDLRNILLKYLNRIEVNFRTTVVYNVSNYYKDSPTWFANKQIMTDEFVSSLDKHYTEKFKRNNKTIRKHHAKNSNDRYAPAWKTLEYFTFGQIFTVYKSLKDDLLKAKIAKLYGFRKNNEFENLMDAIIFVRNTCAHGGVLFDLKIPKQPPKLEFISYNNNVTYTLYSAINIILHFLSKISIEREKELYIRINNLFVTNYKNESLKIVIEKKTGYIFK